MPEYIDRIDLIDAMQAYQYDAGKDGYGVIVLFYFCVGGMVESLLNEVLHREESSALCIIFWPLVVLLLITLSLAYLFAEAGREIGNWINRR